MIPGRSRNHTRAACRLIQQVHFVGGATDLERAGGLQMLAFQQYLATERGGQRRAEVERGHGHQRPDADIGLENPVEKRLHLWIDPRDLVVGVFQPAAQPLPLEQSQPGTAFVVGLAGRPEAAAVGIDFRYRGILQALDRDGGSAEALCPLELPRLPQMGKSSPRSWFWTMT